MKRTGLADAVRALATDGIPVVGLCAGYQIMGRRIADPAGIEGGGEEHGLRILDVHTELAPGKETRQTRARIPAPPPGWLDGAEGEIVAGYEIHHGRTRAVPGLRPWLADGPRDLGHADGAHWGCYLHGAFRNDRLRADWLGSLGLRPAAGGLGRIDRPRTRPPRRHRRALSGCRPGVRARAWAAVRYMTPGLAGASLLGRARTG